MKKGFTLLEVIIGTLIASLLSTMLLYVLLQVTSLQRVVDTRVDVWMIASIVQNQFERDIMGTFAPQATFVEPKKDEKKPSPSLQQAGNATKERKKLENTFYVVRNEQGIKTFSCITTSVLPTYNHPKAHVGRVVYTLVPDKKDKRIFSLMRQEGYAFELEEYIKQNSLFAKIELANNIASMDMRFVTIALKEDGSGIDYEISNDWPLPQKETEDSEKTEEQERLTPDFIQITFVLWRDIARDKKETIVWYVPIVSVSEPFQKKEQEDKKQSGAKKVVQQKQQIKKQPRVGQKTTSMNKYGFPVKMVHN